ncbi:MAG: hypothetical protein IPI67_19570 [Myxococcales bacterium]|nr:hypothetical protein [Myxococcales bacterium]
MNLGLGKPGAWITDRTGRTHAELQLGGLEPLHQAIPDLRTNGLTEKLSQRLSQLSQLRDDFFCDVRGT